MHQVPGEYVSRTGLYLNNKSSTRTAYLYSPVFILSKARTIEKDSLDSLTPLKLGTCWSRPLPLRIVPYSVPSHLCLTCSTGTYVMCPLVKCESSCSSAVLSSSDEPCMFHAMVALHSVQVYSVQLASISDHPAETTICLLATPSLGLRTRKEVIEANGVVHFPLLRGERLKPSEGSGSGHDAGRKVKARGNGKLGSEAFRALQDMYVVHYSYFIPRMLMIISLQNVIYSRQNR